MSDDKRISRRRSLKGIAATGTAIAGAGLGVNPVTAGEEQDDDHEKGKKHKKGKDDKDGDGDGDDGMAGVKTLDFQGCRSVAIIFKESYVEDLAESGESYITTARFRTYNADRDLIENYERDITLADLRTTTLHGTDDTGGVYAYTFNVYQFYDRAKGFGDKVVSVRIDGTTIQNPNDCAEPYQTAPPSGGKVDPDDLAIAAECVDAGRGIARFWVLNANKETLILPFNVVETGESGTVAVEALSVTYFEVALPEGGATARLYYDDEVVDAAESGGGPCVPRDDVAFNFQCYDPDEELAQFYVHNATDDDLTFVVYEAGTGATGRITVEDSLASAETFWVPAPDGQAEVWLYYEGEAVAATASDPSQTC